MSRLRASRCPRLILNEPISDRETLEDVSQSAGSRLARNRKSLSLNGEMSEWLKEHAWKTNPATLTERHKNTSSRSRFNDFPPQNASRCEPVNLGISRRFQGDLTQFLHSSQRHFSAYSTVCVGIVH